MKKLIVLLVSSLLMVAASANPSDASEEAVHDEMQDKLSFSGIDLRSLNKTPKCPQKFLSAEKLNQFDLRQTAAGYLCLEKKMYTTGSAVLIPKEQNRLNAIWIVYTEPFSLNEKYHINIQFDSASEEKVHAYLVQKYGPPHETGSDLYWNFKDQGIEVSYRNIYTPQVRIDFPRDDLK